MEEGRDYCCRLEETYDLVLDWVTHTDTHKAMRCLRNNWEQLHMELLFNFFYVWA